jgi:hypothetical protein
MHHPHVTPARVAVLFARADSVYKSISGVDVWDIERDALKWPGGMPCVAHPPCGPWGRLRHFAKQRPGEKELAVWAVDMVRTFGGVLEHPASSTLWNECRLPRPGQRDQWGGWTLPVVQWWWGHRAEKNTLLYIVGCEPADVPSMPLKLGEPSHVIQTKKRNDHRPHVSKAEREHTPRDLALWLIDLACTCHKSPAASGATSLSPTAATHPQHAPTQPMHPTPDQADEAFHNAIAAPLHRCAPLVILHELFEQWGNLCSPQTTEDGKLPEGFLQLQIGSEQRFFHQDDLRSMLRDLHAELLKQQETNSKPLADA